MNSASTLYQAAWAAVTEAVEEHNAAYLHHPEASHQRVGGESVLTNGMQMDWLDDRVVNKNQMMPSSASNINHLFKSK